MRQEKCKLYQNPLIPLNILKKKRLKDSVRKFLNYIKSLCAELL